jgi:hypothetical protein
MTENNSGVQVSVTDGEILVQMQPKDVKLGATAFAEREIISLPAIVPGYYIALDDQGVMQRCVADCVPDKKVVAALVGNWVADGFDVMRVARKELVKHLRKIESMSKEAVAALSREPSVMAEQLSADPVVPTTVAQKPVTDHAGIETAAPADQPVASASVANLWTD